MRHRFREWSSALKSAVGVRLFGLLLALVGCCLGFVILADEVSERETQSFDESVMLALRRADEPSIPIGPVWLRESARDVTALGSPTVLALVTLAVCGFLVLVRHFRSLLLVLGSTLSGAVLNILLKDAFARPRPRVVPHLTEASSSSFPSGHAMLSAIVYLTLGALLAQLTERRWLKAYVLGVSLVLCFLVGLTRVFLGVHYLTDILGGWMAGLAWALCTALLARGAKRRSPGLREEVREGAEVPGEAGASTRSLNPRKIHPPGDGRA